MASLDKVTFIVAVNDQEVLRSNLLSSPCFTEPPGHQILIQEGFKSAADAYNGAIADSQNELLVFIHQDIYLPAEWLTDLGLALIHLETRDPNWGVLGCYGRTREGIARGYVYSTGLGTLGAPFEQPLPVQTLDEIVLIVRKGSGLRFDDSLPHFHLYGTDLCLSAADRGMASYVISALCVHNTQQLMVLPKEFYDCCRHIKREHSAHLPIYTSCIEITRFNFPTYKMKLQELGLRVRRKHVGATRAENPLALLK